MNRLVLWLVLFGAALSLGAQTPDTEFLAIYGRIEDGERLESEGRAGEALEQFKAAQRDLQQFARSHPSWNERIVKFRLSFLESKVGSLVPRAPVPAAPAAKSATTPAPNPASLPAAPDAGSADRASQQERTVEAEARATAAEARRDSALRSADEATARANRADDRASQLALELREVRDRLEVMETSHRNLDRTRERLEKERVTLEARLKEALSPKAAAVDPAELVKAEERILLLVKENEILKAGLDHQMAENRRILEKARNALELERALDAARAELATQRKQNDELRGERQKLQARVDQLDRKSDERTARLEAELVALRKELADTKAGRARPGSSAGEPDLAALRDELAEQKKATDALRRENQQLSRDLEHLTAIKVPASSLAVAEVPGSDAPEAGSVGERIQQLEREREALQRELDGTRAQLAQRERSADDAQARQLAREVDRLQGRVAALEARPEPYSAEELALFQAPRQLDLAGAPAPVASGRITAFAGSESPVPPRQVAQATPTSAPPASPTAPAPSTNRPPPAVGGSPAPSGTTTNAPGSPVSAPRRRTTKDLPPGAGVLAAQAQRAFAQRRFADAEKAYREILKMDENNVFTVGNLAAILVEQGRLEEGEVLAKRALALDPQDPFSLSLLGIVRFRQQRYDEAFDALSHSAQLDPENSETQNYLGITLSQRGQRPAAEAALRKAIKLNPTSPTAHYNLAVVYATQKPPFLELARYHYEKSRRGGQPANPQFEELLRGGSAPAAANAPAPAKAP